jgi:hypothetical protein
MMQFVTSFPIFVAEVRFLSNNNFLARKPLINVPSTTRNRDRSKFLGIRRPESFECSEVSENYSPERPMNKEHVKSISRQSSPSTQVLEQFSELSLFMGSSVSSNNNSKNRSTPPQPSPAMQTTITQVIPNGSQSVPNAFAPRPLKGILKNKNSVQRIEKPVKIVELYVLRGNAWTVTRVREVSHVPCWPSAAVVSAIYLLLGRGGDP